MSILYVTSFSDKLYKLTGDRLIKTFKSTNSEGDLFCYTEKMNTHLITSESVFASDMGDDDFYNKWFKQNIGIIPDELGGRATKKDNPDAFKVQNFRTAQWTKKIAAMNYAIKNYSEKYDYFMWVDCDCFFINKFTENDLMEILGDKSFCYHLGRDRIKKGMGVETGLIGFKNDKYSNKIVKRWIDKYSSGDFRTYEWWNDAHMFYYLINEDKKLAEKGLDLVKDYESKERAPSHVIFRGSLGKYFDHQKGFHKRNM